MAGVLDQLLEFGRPTAALLADRRGHVRASAGDGATIAALSRGLEGMLEAAFDEAEPDERIVESDGHSPWLLLRRVGEDWLLVVCGTTAGPDAGMRRFARETATRLEHLS